MRVDLEESEEFEVQMGPLIDCVFLLLIFFIVVAVTKKSIEDLKISLPMSVAAVEARHRDEDLVIRVTGEGTVYVGSEEMTQQGLLTAIREKARTIPEAKVRIEADRRTRMRHIQPIVDQCQFYGLTRIAVRAGVGVGAEETIGTIPVEPGKPGKRRGREDHDPVF